MTADAYESIAGQAKDISPELASSIMRIGPINIPNRRHDNLGIFLSRTIVGQQLSTKAAASIWARVERSARELGEEMPLAFSPSHAERFERCGLSRSKYRYLQHVRDAAQSGQLSLGRIASMSSAERAAQLQRIPGVGPWTTDMVSIFFFQEPDIWPSSDASACRMLRIFSQDRAETSQLAALFSPYRSFLALYLWRISDSTPD